MINIKKLNTTVINEVIKAREGSRKRLDIGIEELDHQTIINIGMFNCYILKNDDILFDTGIKELKQFKLHKLFDGTSNTHPLIDENKLYNKGKITYKMLLNKDEQVIFIDIKLLDLYGDELKFEGTTPKSPVYIYHKHELIGLVMPSLVTI